MYFFRLKLLLVHIFQHHAENVDRQKKQFGWYLSPPSQKYEVDMTDLFA